MHTLNGSSLTSGVLPSKFSLLSLGPLIHCISLIRAHAFLLFPWAKEFLTFTLELIFEVKVQSSFSILLYKLCAKYLCWGSGGPSAWARAGMHQLAGSENWVPSPLAVWVCYNHECMEKQFSLASFHEWIHLNTCLLNHRHTRSLKINNHKVLILSYITGLHQLVGSAFPAHVVS